MSNFRNVQNGGSWETGETYTFEVYEPYTHTMDPGFTCQGYPGGWESGENLIGENEFVSTECGTKAKNESNLLFDNINQNDSGAIADTPKISREDMGNDWYKYTITLPVDLPNGKYYFKKVSWFTTFGIV